MMSKVRTRMSAEEFYQLPESQTPTELLDGEVIVSPSPYALHQRTAFNIATLLRDLIPTIGGEVLIAPMDVYLDAHNVVQPDVFWRATAGLCVERDGYFHGPPELVVEVHSPSTIKRDKGEKFALYQRMGVGAYWMADPAAGLIEVWERREGIFARLGVFSEGDSFHAQTLGVTILLDGIFLAP